MAIHSKYTPTPPSSDTCFSPLVGGGGMVVGWENGGGWLNGGGMMELKNKGDLTSGLEVEKG